MENIAGEFLPVVFGAKLIHGFIAGGVGVFHQVADAVTVDRITEFGFRPTLCPLR
jgi:hypothetical protein